MQMKRVILAGLMVLVSYAAPVSAGEVDDVQRQAETKIAPIAVLLKPATIEPAEMRRMLELATGAKLFCEKIIAENKPADMAGNAQLARAMFLASSVCVNANLVAAQLAGSAAKAAQ